MKISGNVLKTYENPVGRKTQETAKKDSQNLESVKSDTLSISSNQVKDVEFPSFTDAKNLLSSISNSIKENPQLVESIHEKFNSENVEFLLR